MIDEKQLEDYRKLFDKNPDARLKFMRVEVDEMLATCEALWTIARAAKKWTKALPGRESVDSECELVKSLEILKEAGRLLDKKTLLVDT